MLTLQKEPERLASRHDWSLLFDELCYAHHLNWRQRRFLKAMSRIMDVEPAVRLFIEPDWFVSAAETDELGQRKRQLAELCKILFHREKR